ncbi:MAG: hypothetical protein II779_04790, partial [Clostridia bacterium]|nr:hypothetical protein [Clostridia bacterium]
MRKTLLCALLFLLTAAVLAVGVSALGEEMTAAYGTPTVDGTVDDVWASADRQPLKYVKAGDLKTDTYTLPDDLSVYASMLYDNTALYFLFEITDNEFAFNSTVGDWKNDCIYLYVDEVGDADPVWTPQQSQIALVPEDGFEMINPARKGTGPSSYQFAYTFPTATTCVIEFKYVPIDMSLKEGTEFMVDFQYNDSVEAATRDYCLGWSDESDNAANDAGIWGYVTLGKAGDAAAPAAPVDADATAAYAAKIPVIDGDIDDIWNTTEAMEAIMYENQEWTVEDLVDMGFATGYTKVLWREDTLYLLAVITDATMDSDAKSTTNGINFWVSETFSGNSDFNQAPGDWHIFCNADGGTNYYTGNKDVYNQAEMAAVRTSDGYIVEAAVPVLTADFEYSAGHKIGYNISVDDDSDADNNRDTFTSWQDYSGRAYWSDPSTLNEVALVAEGSSSGAAASGAELLAKSFDTIFVDGEMMVDGRANDWLAENPVEGDIVQLEVRGWSHLSTPITGYAYTIDGGTAEKSEDFIQDRPDVKAAIHEEAEGFDIQIDVSGLGAGDHLIKVFAIDADGGLVDTGFDFPFTMTGGAAPAPEAPAGYPASGESGNFMMGKVIGNETGWDGTAGSGAAS